MLINHSVYHYALIEFEATTPHAIQSGIGDVTHDVLLFRDANGLPVIPATSLAGVLRSVYQRYFGEQLTKSLFGDLDTNLSFIQVNNALVHNSQNKVQEGILSASALQDELLQKLLEEKPIVRQRVKLNARGVTEETGKFDVTLVPAGVRYTAIIGYWSDSKNADEFNQLLELLSFPEFRLGHGTRAGNGQFKVNQIHYAIWDLKNPEDKIAYQNRTRQRSDKKGLTLWNPTELLVKPKEDITMIELPLIAEAGWRIGGGDKALSAVDENGKVPDLVPQSEYHVIWQDDKAKYNLNSKQGVVIPASAIKGALAHRVAYHYRRLCDQFVNMHSEDPQLENENPKAIRELFGYTEGKDAQIGKVIINDFYLDKKDVKIARQMHNKIDRYTGGVINGALFEEELLWKTPITLNLTILDSDKLEDKTKQALIATLEDLKNGLLPLGACTSRGQGVFVLDTSKANDIIWQGYSFLSGAQS